MATIYTCTEPKDAWSLVSHFLANNLLVISGACDASEIAVNFQDVTEAKINRSRSELIGSLYMLIRRMDAHGYHDEAGKIQQILDMVTDQDVTTAEVRKAIHAKNCEFNAGKREFDATIAELRAKGAFQA